MTESFPLQWPAHRPRITRRERSRFSVSFAKARDELFRELRLMGARWPVLSTNVALRRDGLPYANQPEPSDPGVAIYFEWKKRQMAFSCDRWDRVRDNVQAIRHTIAALRGLDRWGTGDMVEAAFTGFEALPPPGWRGDLGLDQDATLADAERSYRLRARSAHPDAGGSAEDMSRLNVAIARARQEMTAEKESK